MTMSGRAIIIASVILGTSFIIVKNIEVSSRRSYEIQEQLDRRLKEDSERLSKERTEETRLEQLSFCIGSAQEEYDTTFRLNSTPLPDTDQEKGVRRWNSRVISEGAEEKLAKSKDLCAKLYGN